METNMAIFQEYSSEEIRFINGGLAVSTAGMIMAIAGAVVAGVLAPLTCGGSLVAFAPVVAMGVVLMIGGAVLI